MNTNANSEFLKSIEKTDQVKQSMSKVLLRKSEYFQYLKCDFNKAELELIFKVFKDKKDMSTLISLMNRISYYYESSYSCNREESAIATVNLIVSSFNDFVYIIKNDFEILTMFVSKNQDELIEFMFSAVKSSYENNMLDKALVFHSLKNKEV